MDKISETLSERKIVKAYEYLIMFLIPIFFVLFIALVFWISSITSRFYVTAKFSKSGPLYKNMPVYYRGYKIGKTIEIKLSEDYKYTLVKIVLYPQKPKISADIIAKVKTRNEKNDYIDLQIPDEASNILLTNGSIIDGEAAFDLEAFLSDIADAEMIVPMLQTFTDTLSSINKTSIEIKNFFTDSRSLIKENRQNIKQTTEDLSISSKAFVQTTKKINAITSRVNNTITNEKITNTTSSIDKSSTNVLTVTENVKKITQNIDNATKNLDKTVDKIDCTMSKAYTIANNVEVITCGLRETLQKRFAGVRILFGKPIKNRCDNNYHK